jgi:hypothetical protein
MPRKLSPAQLAFLALRRKISKERKWLWKHKRPKMEAGRAKATARATEIRDDAKVYLLDTVREWPAHMTPTELDALLIDIPYTRKGKKRRKRRDSLIRRLRLLGLIEYAPKSNTWTNLCTLPQSKPSAPSDTNDQGTTERPDRPGG